MQPWIVRFTRLGAALLCLATPLLCQVTCGPPPVPEPATFWMIGGGAAALLLLRRYRAKK